MLAECGFLSSRFSVTWKTTSCSYGWLPSGFLPWTPVRRFCDSETISSPSDLFKFKIRLDSKKEERKMENLYLMFSLSFKEQNV